MKIKGLFVLALTFICVGCKVSQVVSAPQPVTATEQAFCANLMKQSIAQGENAFLSPASVAMALNMLTPGAKGATLNELNVTVPDMQIANSEQVKIASALWINKGLKVKSSFINANREAEVYRGRIEASKVNKWASDKTEGKIKEVLQEPLPPIQMAITNAIYFKANWVEPFSEGATEEETFYGKHGEKAVQMMHKTEHWLYAETKKMQAVRMMYRESDYCMDIFLPKEGYSLHDILEEADTTDLYQAGRSEVQLSLPKIKLSYEQQLNDFLKAMGLTTCFTSEADFSGISPTPLYVSMVKQNTYFNLDEKGTEAAAVTVVALSRIACAPRPEPIYIMQVNRPFLLMIRDSENGTILFYGVIYDIPA